MASQTTAVIVNWNGAEFLEKLLAGVVQNQVQELVVIDNASSDASVQVIRNYPQVKLIQNPANLGFGTAANQGIESASTSYVLLLNVDMEVPAGSIQKLEEFLERTPQAAVVAPCLVFPDGRVQPSCRKFPTITGLFLYLSYLDRIFPSAYRLGKEMHKSTMDVDQPMGAALMIRRSVLDQTGLFDPQFFLYMEEVDLCERIKKAGWKIFYFPEVKMVHLAGGSAKQAFEKSQFYFFESTIRYFQKRISDGGLFLLRLSLSAAMPFRTLVLVLRGRFHEAAFCLKMMVRIFGLK